MSGFVIGEEPHVGNMLDSQTFSEKPDGTGKFGRFRNQENYKVSHINIVTDKGFITIKTEGKNLKEILAEYPDNRGYNIHFANSKTGLGFVTQNQLENMINNKVNTIIQSKIIEDNGGLDR